MLAKKHRLAKTTDIKSVFMRGRGFFNPLFNIKYVPGPVFRLTVVVSTKVSKRAVVRNRIKRALREVVRLNISSFKAGDYAIIVKPSAEKVENIVLKERVLNAFKTARLLV